MESYTAKDIAFNTRAMKFKTSLIGIYKLQIISLNYNISKHNEFAQHAY